MALKLVRFIGSVTAATLADDAAHGLELGKLSRGSSFRVSEFGGNDVFFKLTLTSDRTTVTATNGMYLKANSSITVVPEGVLIGSGGGRVVLDRTDSTGTDAGSFLELEDATFASSNVGNALAYNFAETSYFISVINETATSDGAVYIQEVAQGNSV